MCRKELLRSDISLVMNNDFEENTIKGNNSTKIEAIIKLILNLKKMEPNVKVLIFSIWASILKFLESVLRENGIISNILARETYEKKLKAFKVCNMFYFIVYI